MEHINSYLKSETRLRTTGETIRILHTESQTDNTRINSAVPWPYFEPGTGWADNRWRESPCRIPGYEPTIP